jgi:hypothetical protein
MVTTRQNARERLAEIQERLAGIGRTCSARPVGERDLDQGVHMGRLARAFADIGPVFAEFGLYLASRGDLLPWTDCRRLLRLESMAMAWPPERVRQAVAEESGPRADGPRSDAIAWLADEPFDTRWLFQRHYGRLAGGEAVIVRIVTHPVGTDRDLDLVPSLREAIVPLLTDGRSFDQAVVDFRSIVAARSDGLALADSLEALGREASGSDVLRAAKVYRGLSSPRVLVLERRPGRRLSDPGADPDAAETRRSEQARESLGRRLSETWLRLLSDGHVLPADVRPVDIVADSRNEIAFDEGVFTAVPKEARENLVRYLVAVAADDPRKSLDSLLREFHGARPTIPPERLSRLFRQLVPDDGEDGAARLADMLLAQLRLAGSSGYYPSLRVLPALRGLVRLEATVRGLSPHRDGLLEGLKDFRIARLIDEAQELSDPLYWLGRLDAISSTLVAAPRRLDDALTAAGLERPWAQRAAPARDRAAQGHGSRAVPSLILLALAALTASRGLETATAGPWGEAAATAALLLALLLWR